MLAVNICDLSECFPLPGLANMLIRDFVYSRQHTECEKGRIDGAGLLLDGPAADNPERLSALVSLLVSVLGPRKLGRPVRVYQQGKRGGWTKIKNLT